MELLKQKVEEVITRAKQLKKFSICNSSEGIERFVMEREIKQIVEDDFMKKNPESQRQCQSRLPASILNVQFYLLYAM